MRCSAPAAKLQRTEAPAQRALLRAAMRHSLRRAAGAARRTLTLPSPSVVRWRAREGEGMFFQCQKKRDLMGYQFIAGNISRR